MNCTQTELCRMLIVNLIDQTRLGDKSRLLSRRVENGSKEPCTRVWPLKANEPVFACVILDLLGSVLVLPCV